MGLRINTNISSMRALRMLRVNDRNQARSLERLSTGLRINRGADDPSGLVISEQLRSQVAALEQAVTNSQNAMNLINVADAALGEMSSLLVQIQDSIIFAQSTGGATPQQIAAEQDAVDQAVAAIDRIASTTRFADRPLLNGNAEFQLSSSVPDFFDDVEVSSANFAASCSAAFFAFPVALPSVSPATTTSTANTFRWSGPDSAATRYSGSDRPSAWTRSCNADL